MALLRRVGRALCGQRPLQNRENAIFLSSVLSKRHRSATIVAIDKTHIHWFDLGRERPWLLPKISATPSSSEPSSFCREPSGGAIERDSRDGRAVEAELAPLLDLNIHPCDFVVTRDAEPHIGTTYESRSLLLWLIGLPSADAGRFEWLEHMERATGIGWSPGRAGYKYKVATAAAASVVRIPQLEALRHFAARHKMDHHEMDHDESFWVRLIRATDRVAESADPCEVADFVHRLAIAHRGRVEAAMRRPEQMCVRNLVRAAILGGRADLWVVDLATAGAVLDWCPPDARGARLPPRGIGPPAPALAAGDAGRATGLRDAVLNTRVGGRGAPGAGRARRGSTDICLSTLVVCRRSARIRRCGRG